MRADAQRNYAKLLSAASEAFLESGGDDVSLEEIARRAGVGIGTLWLHTLVAFSSTKRTLTAAMVATLDKDSELMSTCSKLIRDAGDSLIARCQQAGVVRADVNGTDVVRLVHGISMVTERTPNEPGQADRMLTLVLDGLRPQAAG